MKARYQGYCPRCSSHHDAGVEIVKIDGRWGHVACPTKTTSASSAPAPSGKRTNRKPGQCDICGAPLAVGEGHLYRCLGSDSGCMRHWDSEAGAWHVECLDEEACAARVARRKAVAAVAKAEAQRRADALRAVCDLFRDGEHTVSEGGQIRLEGEQIDIGTGQTVYGGGSWFVIEPEGDCDAPAPEVIQEARRDLAERKATLKEAIDRLTAWSTAHTPRGSRPPLDGRFFWGKEIEAIRGRQRLEYEALVADVQRLSYTSSPDSYHAAEAEVRRLEDAEFRSTYPRSIWHVRNNGSDGDDWSHNNIRTGGAGAVGRRLPWSSELEAKVREVTK